MRDKIQNVKDGLLDELSDWSPTSLKLILIDLLFVAFMVHPTSVGLLVVLAHVILVFAIRWLARREGREEL